MADVLGVVAIILAGSATYLKRRIIDRLLAEGVGGRYPDPRELRAWSEKWNAYASLPDGSLRRRIQFARALDWAFFPVFAAWLIAFCMR